MILLAGLGFDEVHDLEALATQVPPGFSLPVTTDALARLSDLATEGRYPDEGEAIAADEAAQAIATATKICSADRRGRRRYRPSIASRATASTVASFWRIESWVAPSCERVR